MAHIFGGECYSGAHYPISDHLDEFPTGFCQRADTILEVAELHDALERIRTELWSSRVGDRYQVIFDVYLHQWESGWTNTNVIDVISLFYDEHKRTKISKWLASYRKLISKKVNKYYDITSIRAVIDQKRDLGKRIKKKHTNDYLYETHCKTSKSEEADVIITRDDVFKNATDGEKEDLKEKYLGEDRRRSQARVCSGAIYCPGPRYCPCKPVRKKFPGVSDEVKSAINDRPKRNP